MAIEENSKMPHNFRLVLIEVDPTLQRNLSQFADVKSARANDLTTNFLTEFDPDAIIVELTRAQNQLNDVLTSVRHPVKTPKPGIIVLGLMPKSEPAELRRMIKLGLDHVLIRPVSANNLIRSVRDFKENPVPQVKTFNYIGPDRRRLPSDQFGGSERRR